MWWRRSSAVKGAVLQQQCLQIALNRGHGRAQVVRNIGEQLAAQVVRLSELLHLLHHARRHLAEGAGKATDLVARPARDGGRRNGMVGEPAVLECLHRRGEPVQPAREQLENDEPGDSREQEARGEGPDDIARERVIEPLYDLVMQRIG